MKARTWRLYTAFGVGHFLVTVLADVFIPAIGQGLVDTGVMFAPWWAMLLFAAGTVVSLPLVAPLTMTGVIRPWTPSGAIDLLIVAAVNSLLVTIALWWVLAPARKEQRRTGV